MKRPIQYLRPMSPIPRCEDVRPTGKTTIDMRTLDIEHEIHGHPAHYRHGSHKKEKL
jgi:hypothetical protein